MLSNEYCIDVVHSFAFDDFGHSTLKQDFYKWGWHIVAVEYHTVLNLWSYSPLLNILRHGSHP